MSKHRELYISLKIHKGTKHLTIVQELLLWTRFLKCEIYLIAWTSGPLVCFCYTSGESCLHKVTFSYCLAVNNSYSYPS